MHIPSLFGYGKVPPLLGQPGEIFECCKAQHLAWNKESFSACLGFWLPFLINFLTRRTSWKPGYTQLWLPQAQRILALAIAGLIKKYSTVQHKHFCSCVGCYKPRQHDPISVPLWGAGMHCFSWNCQYLSPTQQIHSSQVYKSPSLPDLEESLMFYGVYLETQAVVALLHLSKGALFLLFPS